MIVDLNDLARRAQQGEAGAFDLLAEAVVPHGHRLAWRLLGDADKSADLLQDFLIKLLRVLDRYDPQRPFLPWALRIITRMSLDLSRKENRYEHILLDGAESYPAPSSECPDRQLEVADARLLLDRLTSELSPAQRNVFILRDLEGFNVNEIAELTETAASTVRVHLSKARIRVREAIPLLESDEVIR